ncbi:ADTRP protein, partial [Polyodon spathula]|nr:ADTRP protein [Polyodon spathula]
MNGIIWSKAYHLAMFVWYTFLFTILLLVNPDDLPDGVFVYGGRWKYLTFLNLVLQMVFFGFAVVIDLQHVFVKGKDLKMLNLYKDLLYSVMVFPVGAVSEPNFLFLFLHCNTGSHNTDFTVQVCWIYFTVGIWVYPLLGKFSPLGLAALFLVSVGLVMSLFLFGEALNCYVWGKSLPCPLIIF